jgi:hypothetical protein
MKKIILFLAFSMASVALCAQNNPFRFFPNTEGAQLVNQSYDAQNNLLGTTVMTVEKDYQYVDAETLQIGFVMTDPAGNVMDQGKINAHYDGGRFYLHSGDRTISPNVMKYLSLENELSGDFLDYPDPWGSDTGLEPIFAMEAGKFTIRSKSDKQDLIQVRKYGRKYEGNEEITTPAGNFHGHKVTYNMEVTHGANTETLRGVEWYAPGAGIVRSDIYSGDQLLNYTVLTELKK